MSQMPDKIWVHKDTKYSTTDEVFGYQYEFAQGIQDEGIKNFVEYVPFDSFIEKALAYLNEKFYFNNLHYAVENNTFNCMEEMFEDFKNYMKGE